MLFNISPFSEDYPNVLEALQAKEEFEIVKKQSMNLFLSKPVIHFLSMAVRESADIHLFTADVFYYGYMLGKRAERKRNHERYSK